MLNRFHSAVIRVGDFDAARSHYERLLGRAPSWLGHSAQRGTRSVLYSLANMALEISEIDGAADAGESDGLHAIRFASDESGDLAAWLAERGIPVLERTDEVAEEVAGTGLREWTRFAIDPDSSRGIEIDLVSETIGSSPSDAMRNVGPGAAIRDLDHVVVFSPDVEATRSFYKEDLGLRLALDKNFEERQVRLLFFRLGGVTVEIGSRLGAVPEPGSTDGFGGLAWEVEDADVIHERLVGEGFDVSEVRRGHKAGTRVCTVRNPVHGVPTLLVEPVSR